MISSRVFLYLYQIPTIEFDFIETFTIKPEALLNITHLYIRSNNKLARPEFIEVRYELN